MKIAITGHTSGLGRHIFENLNMLGHDCTGLSRKNGYHLKRHQKEIVEIACSHDVFINCAHKDFHQVEIFDKLIPFWKQDSSKTIINISCWDKFSPSKNKILASACNSLDKSARAVYLDRAGTACRVLTLTLGPFGGKLTPKDICNTIEWYLTLPKNLEITELTLLPK